MNSIQFWYPAMPGPDVKNPERKSGVIHLVNISHEPYEISVCAGCKSFNIVFGSKSDGHFLCIPEYGLGCRLGPYSGRFFNQSVISGSCHLEYQDACAIANALSLIEFMLGKDISC